MEEVTNMQKLCEYLHGRRATKGSDRHPDILGMGGSNSMVGKYKFRDMSVFWDKYRDAAFEEGITENLTLAEVPRHNGDWPVLGDIDISISPETYNEDFSHVHSEAHVYDPTHVAEVVTLFQDALRDRIPDIQEEQLLALVLEKPRYQVVAENKVQKYKNGFHLHFPMLFVYNEDYKKYVFPLIQEGFNKSSLKTDLGKNVELDDVSTKPWLLYGSAKESHFEPYRITGYYTHDGNFSEDWRPVLCGYKIQCSETGLFNPVDSSEIDFELPKILSIRHEKDRCYRGVIVPPPNAPAFTKTQRDKIFKQTSQKTILQDLTLAKNLLDECISDERASSYQDWSKIGMILASIGRGEQGEESCDQAFEIWDEFSQRAPDKYDQPALISRWNTYSVARSKGGKGLTMGTLRFYAKLDNPSKYEKITSELRHERCNNTLQGSTRRPTDYQMAKLLLDLEPSRIIFAPGQKSGGQFYYFNGISWEPESNDDCKLRSLMSEELVEDFRRARSELVGIMLDNKSDKDDTSGSGPAHNAEKMKTVAATEQMLQDNPSKERILKECRNVFANRNFVSLLDKEGKCIAFKNGIYDMRSIPHGFRSALPDDFISKTLPIHYSEYTQDHDDIIQLKLFFERLFPDSEVREYVLDKFSSFFEGGNFSKEFMIWKGGGNNGKSVCANLLGAMFGDLHRKFQTSIFSGKRGEANGAAPMIARARPPTRLVVLEEPDKGEVMNVGLLKQLTGNDSVYARDLYQAGSETTEFTPMFKIILHCNELPELRGADQATWNRIRVIPFESEFVDQGVKISPESKNTFHKDPALASSMPEWMLPAAAWFLLDRWSEISRSSEEGGRQQTPCPDKVLEATKLYSTQYDNVQDFFMERISIEGTSTVKFAVIFSTFQSWYREQGKSDSTRPSKNSIQDWFERYATTTKQFEILNRRGDIKGIRLRSETEVMGSAGIGGEMLM